MVVLILFALLVAALFLTFSSFGSHKRGKLDVRGRNTSGTSSAPTPNGSSFEAPNVHPLQKPSPKAIRHRTKGVEHDPPPEIPSSKRLRGKAWVIDGDTIVVSKIKVRLAGIDAPELDQPWGKKAKWEMVKICKGQTIDVELTGETSYDRLVGTCYLSDRTDIGAELIKAGLALDGGHFSRGKYRHLEPEGIRKKLKFYGHWR
ncbi:thermonuclease family protein [Aliiroseovarius crassostreae]|uniref:thermonuclease family protein n=1 Tax=Aliiroseovarius crassostreae TaxID=154981 RepID=UPI00220ADAA4|nr:thermonuclease family protein [Aliiroseovarius crassostreae]UWQ05146.1 thermonuclease family protein [Aliiroseovarius crassostreae]